MRSSRSTSTCASPSCTPYLNATRQPGSGRPRRPARHRPRRITPATGVSRSTGIPTARPTRRPRSWTTASAPAADGGSTPTTTSPRASSRSPAARATPGGPPARSGARAATSRSPTLRRWKELHAEHYAEIRSARIRGASVAPHLRLLAGDHHLMPSGLLARGRLRQLFDQLREDSDYVLVDTVPVSTVADASVVAAAADAVILVVDLERVRRRDLASAKKQLANARANLLGIVVNRAAVDFPLYHVPEDFPPARARPGRIGVPRAAVRMPTPPRSVVMGDIDLVRALGLAGITSAYVGPPDASARFSRHVERRRALDGPVERAGRARRQAARARAHRARSAGPLPADRCGAAAGLAPPRGARRGVPLRAGRGRADRATGRQGELPRAGGAPGPARPPVRLAARRAAGQRLRRSSCPSRSS